NGKITQGSLDAGYLKIGKPSNLEWCSKKKTLQHAVRLGLQRQCGVKQMFDDWSCQEFPSLAEAQRITGIDRSNIGKVCKGRLASAGGYHWEYLNVSNTS
ncbi:6710_t:CDS:2, partial [Diversispora eburnea]